MSFLDSPRSPKGGQLRKLPTDPVRQDVPDTSSGSTSVRCQFCLHVRTPLHDREVLSIVAMHLNMTLVYSSQYLTLHSPKKRL